MSGGPRERRRKTLAPGSGLLATGLLATGLLAAGLLATGLLVVSLLTIPRAVQAQAPIATQASTTASAGAPRAGSPSTPGPSATPLAHSPSVPAACQGELSASGDYRDLSRPRDRFSRCLRAYDEGDHATAVGCFTSLLDDGHDRANVFYDLGNAWYRQDRPDCAQWAYLAAARRSPRDPDIAENLDTARRSVVDELGRPERSPFRRITLFWFDRATPGELWWAAGLLLVVAAVLSLPADERRRRALLPLVFGLLFLGGALAKGVQQRRAPAVVVVVPEVAARSARDPGSVELFRLHAGAELRLLDEVDDSQLLGLPDGTRGWVPAAAVGVVP